MVMNGKTIDLLSLTETLMRKGLLEQVGGGVYISPELIEKINNSQK